VEFFLIKLQKEEAESLPDGEIFYLPPHDPRVYYERYRSECAVMLQCDRGPVGQYYFYHMWSCHFRKLKIRSHGSRHSIGICTTCSTISQNLRIEAERVGGNIAHYRSMMDAHRKMWRGSRLAAVEIWEDAYCGRPCKSTGLRSICLIIDAMENAKLRVPHSAAIRGKELKDLRRPEFRVLGVCAAFSSGGVSYRKDFLYILGPEHGKGPNVTCEITCKVLARLSEYLHEIAQLDVILDNTVAENKCSMVNSFLQGLPASGAFVVARALYLVTGHTHWLVDAMFGVVSNALFRRNMKMFLEDDADVERFLKEKVYRAENRARLHVEIIRHVRNWKALMMFVGLWRNFHGTLGPGASHVFHFQASGNVVQLRTGQWLGVLRPDCLSGPGFERGDRVSGLKVAHWRDAGAAVPLHDFFHDMGEELRSRDPGKVVRQAHEHFPRELAIWLDKWEKSDVNANYIGVGHKYDAFLDELKRRRDAGPPSRDVVPMDLPPHGQTRADELHRHMHAQRIAAEQPPQIAGNEAPRKIELYVYPRWTECSVSRPSPKLLREYATFCAVPSSLQMRLVEGYALTAQDTMGFYVPSRFALVRTVQPLVRGERKSSGRLPGILLVRIDQMIAARDGVAGHFDLQVTPYELADEGTTIAGDTYRPCTEPVGNTNDFFDEIPEHRCQVPSERIGCEGVLVWNFRINPDGTIPEDAQASLMPFLPTTDRFIPPERYIAPRPPAITNAPPTVKLLTVECFLCGSWRFSHGSVRQLRANTVWTCSAASAWREETGALVNLGVTCRHLVDPAIKNGVGTRITDPPTERAPAELAAPEEAGTTRPEQAVRRPDSADKISSEALLLGTHTFPEQQIPSGSGYTQHEGHEDVRKLVLNKRRWTRVNGPYVGIVRWVASKLVTGTRRYQYCVDVVKAGSKCGEGESFVFGATGFKDYYVPYDEGYAM